MMPFPNPLLVSNNNFVGHRRAYPYRTRLAIAADLGFDGYEFHPIEPDDERAWEDAAAAYRRSGLRRTGMYVVAQGCGNDDGAAWDAQLERVRRIIDRLALLEPQAYLNFTIAWHPAGTATADFRDGGSAKAGPQNWDRAERMLKAVDEHLTRKGLSGSLFNHLWFLIDTPAAEMRLLSAVHARAIRPGLAVFHAHFHPGVPDLPEILAQPGMDRLAYVALLNGWPKPAEPFRTRPLHDGNIDMAGTMGLLWSRGYTGPIACHGYDLGGDPYETLRQAREYMVALHTRFQRNPNLNPWTTSPLH